MKKDTTEPLQARMMHAFHRIKKVNIAAMMELPQMEFFALQIISRYQEDYPDREGIYVSELAEKLRIASSQTSRMLRNLEEREVIGRKVDVKDRRNTYIFLTEKGNETCERAKKRLTVYMSQVQAKMGEERVEVLLQLCNELADVMEQEAKYQIELIKKDKPEDEK